MAGCTVSPLDFNIAMEVWASKWIVGRLRLQDSTRLPPIRTTTTAPWTRRLLARFNDNLEWPRINVTLSKSRSVSISKGKLLEGVFYIDGEVIQL